MRVRFLGTSAGELYPGLWCRCRHCQQARQGDPRDRRQSAALYVEPGVPSQDEAPAAPGQALLLDFPSEIASQAHQHQVGLPDLQNLLVTHSHGDHWFPYLLRWRSRPAQICSPGEAAPAEFGAPRFTDLPTLHIWGNAAVESVLHRELGDDLGAFAIAFHPVRAGDTFRAGEFAITALGANHDVGREEVLHYIVEDGGRTLLYGLDGDTFLPATRQALRASPFDVVVLEATFGFGNGRNHRNFDRLIQEAAWFREEGLMTAAGRIIASHFSPHHCPPHRETTDYLRPFQIEAAWDGMEIRS
jgi:phosphoribosyl 1,2-cyclic phosphate phosphodiesterase